MSPSGRELIAKGRVSEQKLELIVPSSFLPFVRVDEFSPHAIRLGAWPEMIYASREIAGGMGRLPEIGTRLLREAILG